MAWSPTSTEKWLQCPMRWWLDRQGAIGRSQPWSHGRLAGTVFHAGMQQDLRGQEWDALAAVKAEWPEGLAIGGPLVLPLAREEIAPEWVASRVLRAIALARQQGVPGGVVLATELNLGGSAEEAARHGCYPGTVDLVTADDDGNLMVTDYKTHWKMWPAYADGELRQTQRSWQLRQYAYFVQERYQRPVTRIRKVLVAFTPVLKVWMYEHPITQQELSHWYAQACEVWEQMDAQSIGDGYNVMWQNADACERYGWNWRCPHYETCWDGEKIRYEGA